MMKKGSCSSQTFMMLTLTAFCWLNPIQSFRFHVVPRVPNSKTNFFSFEHQGRSACCANAKVDDAAADIKSYDSIDAHRLQTKSVTELRKKLNLPVMIADAAGEAVLEILCNAEKFATDKNIPLSRVMSTLSDFDAQTDIPLTFLGGSKLIRKKAQTAANVSSYKDDYSDDIRNSYVWEHEFFPGVKTRGFDPTLLNDFDQVPNLENKIAGENFAINCLPPLAKNFFEFMLPIKPDSQGKWNDRAGDKEHLESLKTAKSIVARRLLPFKPKPKPSFHVENDVKVRTDWKMKEYFNADEVNGLSQDPSLRYLYEWPTNGIFDDKLFSQFYLASIGQSFVTGVDSSDKNAEGSSLVALLDYASKLDVKENHGKYGGDIYFDKDGMVSHIFYNGVRYDRNSSDWDQIKMKSRGTVLMVLTSIEHLLGVHLHFSNSLAMATPLLKTDHPLRRLLWPHIFNAIGVNRKAAATLSIDGGLFSRGWGLTLKGVHQAYHHSLEQNPLFRWQTPRELFKKRHLGSFGEKMPLYEDGLPFFDVVKKYVSSYINHHYKTDEEVYNDYSLVRFHANLNEHVLNHDLPNFTTREVLSDVLATYIYYVTGYHTHAGTAHLEAIQEGVAPSSFYANEEQNQGGAPPNADMWAALTFIGTASLTLPITGDTKSTEWRSGFKEKMAYQRPAPADAAEQPPVEPIGYPEFFEGEEEKAINKQWAVNLVNLQKEIVARNTKRFEGKGYPPALSRVYNAFDVNFVENGVAI